MKKIAFFASFIFAAFFVFAACSADSVEKKSAPKKHSIVATTYPQHDWLKNILGSRLDSVDLKLLIKNGTDLHSYKPSALDIATIANADMVVFIGGESDEWIEKALEATPKAGRIQLNLMKALGDRVKEEEVVEGMEHEHHEHAEEHEHEHHEHAEEHEHEHHEHAEEHEHEHHEHAEKHEHEHHEHAEEHEHEHHEHAEKHEHEHHEHAEEAENDEHIWLSLKNASILVKELANALVNLEPEHEQEYRANASAYTAKINELDEAFRAMVAGSTHKTVLFGDRFPFRYLVDDYDIKYYAAFVGCSAESEASFETIAFLANKMDSLALPAIFTIDGSDGKIAKAILSASKKSKETPVLTINSMQSVKDDQIKAGANYLSIMQSNLEILKQALK